MHYKSLAIVDTTNSVFCVGIWAPWFKDLSEKRGSDTEFLGCSLHNLILDICSLLCSKFMHKSKFKLDMIGCNLNLCCNYI